MKKVLIVKTSSLGDIIHTLPAITDAVSQVPDISFDWVVEKSFSEIPSWHPAVDRVMPVQLRQWRKSLVKTWRSGEWAQFKKEMRKLRYHYVIDAQGLMKSAWVVKHARGQKYGQDWNSAREGMASMFYDHPQVIPRDMHAVERTRLLFAKSLGYHVPNGTGRYGLDLSVFSPLISKDERPYLVFLHGTTREDKHYPEVYWNDLIDRAGEAGFDVRMFWSNGVECARAERLSRGKDHVHVQDKMNLFDVARVLAHAQGVIAVDTGLAHLTAALEKPCVVVYGPTDPGLIGTYGVHQSYLESKLCNGQPPAGVEVSPEVFRSLTPDIVWERFSELKGL